MPQYSLQEKKPTKFTDRRLFKVCLVLVILGLFIGALLIWTFAIPLESTPVIITENGPVQGSVKYSRDGRKYWQFLSIPYAKPPVDELKFLPPQPPNNWTEVKQVTSYPPVCAQFDIMLTSAAKGELDCLYLNVFVSADEENEGNSTKPVLVYIHGGGYISGGSRIYQPDFIMDQDVILVVMNYRLGPYGFLNLGSASNVTGNSGMLDQLFALRWIQRNILNFGGDPQRVTLIGESAGASATHLHVLSPLSNKGLFHKAIIQSGTAISPFGYVKNPSASALEYARRLGCPVENVTDLLPCYQNADWKQLVSFQKELLSPLEEKYRFAPTVHQNFLPSEPEDILKSGNFPDIPIMFGVNEAEGAILAARFEAYPELIETLDKKWGDVIHNLIAQDKKFDADIAERIRQFYFGNATFTEDTDFFLRKITDLLSDVGFLEPTHNSAIYHASKGAPTYLYYYNYTAKLMPGFYTVFRSIRKDDWLPATIKIGWGVAIDWISEYIFGGGGSRPFGVNHGEDVFQLFRVDKAPKFVAWWDRHFSRDFVKVIVDFASDKQPLKFRDLEWPSINDDLKAGTVEGNVEIPYMLLDTEDKSNVIQEPFTERVKFWNEIRKEIKDREQGRS